MSIDEAQNKEDEAGAGDQQDPGRELDKLSSGGFLAERAGNYKGGPWKMRFTNKTFVAGATLTGGTGLFMAFFLFFGSAFGIVDFMDDLTDWENGANNDARSRRTARILKDVAGGSDELANGRRSFRYNNWTNRRIKNFRVDRFLAKAEAKGWTITRNEAGVPVEMRKGSVVIDAPLDGSGDLTGTRRAKMNFMLKDVYPGHAIGFIKRMRARPLTRVILDISTTSFYRDIAQNGVKRSVRAVLFDRARGVEAGKETRPRGVTPEEADVDDTNKNNFDDIDGSEARAAVADARANGRSIKQAFKQGLQRMVNSPGFRAGSLVLGAIAASCIAKAVMEVNKDGGVSQYRAYQADAGTAAQLALAAAETRTNPGDEGIAQANGDLLSLVANTEVQYVPGLNGGEGSHEEVYTDFSQSAYYDLAEGNSRGTGDPITDDFRVQPSQAEINVANEEAADENGGFWGWTKNAAGAAWDTIRNLPVISTAVDITASFIDTVCNWLADNEAIATAIDIAVAAVECSALALGSAATGAGAVAVGGGCIARAVAFMVAFAQIAEGLMSAFFREDFGNVALSTLGFVSQVIQGVAALGSQENRTGRPADTEEYNRAVAQWFDQKKIENQNLPFAERYFAVSTHGSIGRTMAKWKTRVMIQPWQHTAASVLKLPATGLSALIDGTVKKVHAQADDYDGQCISPSALRLDDDASNDEECYDYDHFGFQTYVYTNKFDIAADAYEAEHADDPDNKGYFAEVFEPYILGIFLGKEGSKKQRIAKAFAQTCMGAKFIADAAAPTPTSTTANPPGTPNGGAPLTVLGDSITHSAKEEIEAILLDDVAVFSQPSRAVDRTAGEVVGGIDTVNANAEKFAQAERIVVALGTNESNDIESYHDLIDILPDVPIAFVKLFGNINHKDEYNQYLDGLADQYDNVYVLDAPNFGAGDIAGDGVHLNGPGQEKFAEVVTSFNNMELSYTSQDGAVLQASLQDQADQAAQNRANAGTIVDDGYAVLNAQGEEVVIDWELNSEDVLDLYNDPFRDHDWLNLDGTEGESDDIDEDDEEYDDSEIKKANQAYRNICMFNRIDEKEIGGYYNVDDLEDIDDDVDVPDWVTDVFDDDDLLDSHGGLLINEQNNIIQNEDDEDGDVAGIYRNNGELINNRDYIDLYEDVGTYVEYLYQMEWVIAQGTDPEDFASATNEPGHNGSYSEPVAGNTADVPCAPGTEDVGTDNEAYSQGERYEIRLCQYGGRTIVNSTISQRWKDMYDAAQSEGLNLEGGGMRTMADQIYFYNCMLSGDCNNGNTAAKPGYSNHQMGFAIDIDCAKSGAGGYNSTCYFWLSENAGKYGFAGNVPGESWHWSITGN